MKLLDGQELSNKIIENLKLKVNNLKQNNIIPGLGVVLVGDNRESTLYVELKEKICLRLGMHFNLIKLPKDVDTEKIICEIELLNVDNLIHGIIIQLHLPNHINEEKVLNTVVSTKDVDGFHEKNAGKLFLNRNTNFVPCTPLGCIRLIEHYGINIEKLKVCIIGCSNIVGLPLSMMLLRRNATVTLCHKHTKDLKEHTLKSDIIFSCCGVPNIVTADMVKPGVIIVDIGINYLGGKLVGDVDFNSVKEKCSLITPVPGGIGPMTIAMLMEQTIQSAIMINMD